MIKDRSRASKLGAMPAWAAHLLAALGSALAFFVLPRWAPSQLSLDIEAIVLGVVLGIVLGVMLRVPARLSPSFAVGATLGSAAYFGAAEHIEAATVVISAVIGLELWLMATFLRRTGGWRLRNPRDLIAYVLPVLAVSSLGGLLVVIFSTLGGFAGGSPPGEVWRTWVIDDVFAVVVITPAVITLRWPRDLRWPVVVEWGVAASFSLLMTVQLFFRVEPGAHGLFDWPYFVALGSLWIAVRMGVRAVAPVVAIQYWLGAIGAVTGVGVFALEGVPLLQRLLSYEVLVTAFALVTLALAVLRDSRVTSERSLLRSQQLLSAVVAGSPSVVYAKSYDEDDAAQGRYVLANDAWEDYSGLTPQQTLGHSDAELWPEEVAEPHQASDRLVMGTREALEYSESRPLGQDDAREFQAAKFPLMRSDGTAWGVGVVATDVTDLSRARSEHETQAALLHAIFDLSPTPAVRLKLVPGRSPLVTLGNAALARLLSCPDGFIHEGLPDLVVPEDLEVATDLVAAAVKSRIDPLEPGRRQQEVRLQSHDGREVWVAMHAALIGSTSAEPEVVVQFEDITARRSAELALRDQATRDAVTGLPNRRALQERMQVAVDRLRRRPGLVGVLFCDLDRFKDVNDSMGHQAGDVLLKEVADRLRGVLRPEDTVARLGGDEFVVLAEDLRSEREAVILSLRLQDRLAEIWRYESRDFRPAMSIGIALATGPEVGVDELLRRADLAMYRAKEGGRNRVEVYETGIDRQVQAAVDLQQELRRAIDLDRLVLAYQPIVALQTGEQVGSEALVRLPRGDGTFRSPAEFVPQAEATGLIVPLGAWVVRQVLADLRRVIPDDRSGFVSVNVSAVQLRGEGFVSLLLDEIHSRSIPVSRLVVEVTETALIHDSEHSRRELSRLHDAGIRVALDDFGTGYSSLSWLTRFPVDIVKIDRAFTADLGIDDRKTSVVAAMIAVSHDLGFSVVAEGIETEDQRDRLLSLGCDRGQGFLFGRPETLPSREAVPTLDG